MEKCYDYNDILDEIDRKLAFAIQRDWEKSARDLEELGHKSEDLRCQVDENARTAEDLDEVLHCNRLGVVLNISQSACLGQKETIIKVDLLNIFQGHLAVICVQLCHSSISKS